MKKWTRSDTAPRPFFYNIWRALVMRVVPVAVSRATIMMIAAIVRGGWMVRLSGTRCAGHTRRSRARYCRRESCKQQHNTQRQNFCQTSHF